MVSRSNFYMENMALVTLFLVGFLVSVIQRLLLVKSELRTRCLLGNSTSLKLLIGLLLFLMPYWFIISKGFLDIKATTCMQSSDKAVTARIGRVYGCNKFLTLCSSTFQGLYAICFLGAAGFGTLPRITHKYGVLRRWQESVLQVLFFF